MKRLFPLAVLAALGLSAAPATAREVYVADSMASSVSVIETSLNAKVATIAVGGEPVDVAITPDGRKAYVTDAAAGAVAAIDVAARAVRGAPIAVGAGARGIAIAPDGSRAYVANGGSDSVSVIDTAADAVVATIPLEPGAEPDGVAIVADGSRVLVAQRGGDVVAISTAANAVVGRFETALGLGPSRLSLTTDGGRAFLSNANSNSVTVFDTTRLQVVGSPLLVGTNPSGVAVNPNGPRTYAAAQSADTVVAIDTAAHGVIGSPVPGFEGPRGIAIAPDGRLAYVTDSASSTVTILDTLTNFGAGKIEVGAAPAGIAFVPDQGPRASFSIPSGPRAGDEASFDATASTDPDGRIAIYSWDFGDGEAESGPGPTVAHTYARPGRYTVTLRVSDAEGCSAELRYTGQTVSCNGSATAIASAAVEVIDATPPAFRLSAPRRQRLRRFVVAIGRCPLETCVATARGHLRAVARAGERPLRRRAKSRPARRLLKNGVERRFLLRLGRRALRLARRALAADGRATVRVAAAARDAAGNRRRRSVQVRLVQPAREKARRERR